MAFTRPWDDTFPPDTQQANLLGQDIRRDKEDTAERIRAFGAGKIANRETPEADFGNANIGALFFAEDEGKLYRWDGTTWLVARDFDKVFVDSTVVAFTPGASDLSSITIPANTLKVGSIIEVVARANLSAGGGASFSLEIGPSFSLIAVDNPAVGAIELRATIFVLTAATQRSIGVGLSFDTFASTQILRTSATSPIESIASAIEVATHTNGGATGSSDLLIVKVRP